MGAGDDTASRSLPPRCERPSAGPQRASADEEQERWSRLLLRTPGAVCPRVMVWTKHQDAGVVPIALGASIQRVRNQPEAFGVGGIVESTVPGGEGKVVGGEHEGGSEVQRVETA